MSSSRARLRGSLISATPFLALSCFGIAAAPALAQDAGEADSAATQLGGVTVTDTAIEDSYKEETISSPKYTQPVQNTPQTIQIIDRNLFEQQAATTLTEALRNSPGVGTFYAGENGNTTSGDALYMRGFDTSSSIFVDGVRDMGSVSRDVFNTEQVEVLRGPAGTDIGRSAPTGAINLVSKRAQLDSALSGILTIGTDGQKRGTADANQPLDGVLGGAAIRLNLLVQNSDVAGRDHVKNDRVGIAPSFGIGLEGSTRAWLNLLYVDQNNVPDGFVPTIGLPGWEPQAGLEPLVGNPVDPENFYGTRQDYDDVTAKMATLIVEHDFSPAVSLTNIARYGETKQDYLLTAFMSTSGNISVGSPIEDSTLARSLATTKDVSNRIFANQLALRADFATGSVAHNLVIGAEYTHEKQINYGISSTGSRPAANLYDPDWNEFGDYSFSRNDADNEGKTETVSAYIFDTAKFFDDMLQITGGVRIDHYNTDYLAMAVCNNGSGRGAVPCNGAPLGTIVTTADLSAKDTLFNWKLGAVYKPVDPISLYVNYAVSKQPPGGENFQLSSSATSANNPRLDPQEAETIEAGVKWNALGEALLLSAAVFQTTVKNEINRDDLDVNGDPTKTGEKRVKGIELFAVGNITDAWSISAGYSHLDTDVTEGPVITSDGSPNLTYTPGDSFTAWTSYRLPFGLELGGGVRHVGGLRRGTDGAQGTPTFTEDYTVVDAFVSYALTDNIRLRANANNLFDEDYVASINKSGYRYTPGTPQTFLFSADFRF